MIRKSIYPAMCLRRCKLYSKLVTNAKKITFASFPPQIKKEMCFFFRLELDTDITGKIVQSKYLSQTLKSKYLKSAHSQSHQISNSDISQTVPQLFDGIIVFLSGKIFFQPFLPLFPPNTSPTFFKMIDVWTVLIFLFLFQKFNDRKKIDSEKKKFLIGLKTQYSFYYILIFCFD